MTDERLDLLNINTVQLQCRFSGSNQQKPDARTVLMLRNVASAHIQCIQTTLSGLRFAFEHTCAQGLGRWFRADLSLQPSSRWSDLRCKRCL
jgi:hypothetical protein